MKGFIQSRPRDIGVSEISDMEIATVASVLATIYIDGVAARAAGSRNGRFPMTPKPATTPL